MYLCAVTGVRPVELTVKRYYGTIPWRGATNTIVTSFREL